MGRKDDRAMCADDCPRGDGNYPLLLSSLKAENGSSGRQRGKKIVQMSCRKRTGQKRYMGGRVERKRRDYSANPSLLLANPYRCSFCIRIRTGGLCFPKKFNSNNW